MPVGARPMRRMTVGCTLHSMGTMPTSFVLQVAVAQTAPQTVCGESVTCAPASAAAHSEVDRTGNGFVANFAQEVVKGQLLLSVEGIRRPGSRTVRPQCGPRFPLRPPLAVS